MFKLLVSTVRRKYQISRYKTTKKKCHWEVLLGGLGPLKSRVPQTISAFLSPGCFHTTFKIPRDPKILSYHSHKEQF